MFVHSHTIYIDALLGWFPLTSTVTCSLWSRRSRGPFFYASCGDTHVITKCLNHPASILMWAWQIPSVFNGYILIKWLVKPRENLPPIAKLVELLNFYWTLHMSMNNQYLPLVVAKRKFAQQLYHITPAYITALSENRIPQNQLDYCYASNRIAKFGVYTPNINKLILLVKYKVAFIPKNTQKNTMISLFLWGTYILLAFPQVWPYQAINKLATGGGCYSPCSDLGPWCLAEFQAFYLNNHYDRSCFFQFPPHSHHPIYKCFLFHLFSPEN